MRDFDHALAACQQAIALGPNANALNAGGDPLGENRSKADYYSQRGFAYHGKKDLDHAIADYSEALRLYPKHVRALRDRARAYQDKGDTARANADLEAAKQLAR